MVIHLFQIGRTSERVLRMGGGADRSLGADADRSAARGRVSARQAHTAAVTHLVIKASFLLTGVVIAAVMWARPGAASPGRPVPFMDHDGVYRVGQDITPGLYLTAGASNTGPCSWSRLSSAAAEGTANVIAHGEAVGAQYVLVAATDIAFESRGCQTWSIGTRPATPIAPVPKTCIYPLTGCNDPNEPS